MITEEFRSICFNNLKAEEGYSVNAYKDTVGILTIGIGHNLKAKPIDSIINRQFHNIITDSECKLIFNYDLNSVIVSLDKELPWWSDLNEPTRYVLVSLCFNLGIGGLLKFKNTLAMIKEHRFSDAALNLQKSLWFTQVGSRGTKLTRILKTQQL